MTSGRAGVDKINIRPGVSILSVLSHLNYKHWFAMAEFVDNSLQSFLKNRDRLIQAEGPNFKLRVTIDVSSEGNGRITVRDNAAGISLEDYPRAFKPADIPPDRTGLAEFGVGMKSAACWFSKKWSVRTSALGEEIERTVNFDIHSIVAEKTEDLDVKEAESKANIHFTEIILEDLHRAPKGNTLKKIKEHLASIFRVFLREGQLELVFDGDPLVYVEPPVLSAPDYRDLTAPPVRWYKEIAFDFGEGQKVTGFAAIRDKASTSLAGFALFRRRRLVQGSGDEGYRPEQIFKKSNSYTYQRLFGELHLEGFEVSHTKDGFQWEDSEETFLELLKEHLDLPPLQLLEQAEEHRARTKTQDLRTAAVAATKSTVEVLEKELATVYARQLEQQPENAAPPEALASVQEIASEDSFEAEFKGVKWEISFQITNDPAVSDWLEIGDTSISKTDAKQGIRKLNFRLSVAHPFMERFTGNDPDKIAVVLRVAAAMALAEVSAREAGVRQAGTIRRNVNELLRDALSKPS